MKALLLAAVVLVIDGDTTTLPRDYLCMTVGRGATVTLHLRGDVIFADGFEKGLAAWGEAKATACPRERRR